MKLIATENYTTHTSIADIVRGLGHECRATRSVQESINLGEHERPDAILVDMEWATDNSEELINQIKSHFPGTPTIAISAQDDDEIINRIFRLGATAYLIKPVPELVFQQTLEKLPAV